jgi:hypothetical protein
MEQDLNSNIMGKEQVTTTKQVIIKFAIIYGLAMIVLALVSYILDLGEKNIFVSAISMLTSIGILYFGFKTRKNEIEGGFLTYGQGVATGLGIVALAALIITLYTYIFHQFIDPDYINRVLEQSRVEMIEKGVPDETIEASMKFTENFKNPLFSAFTTFFGTLFMGTVFSLIVAIFTKNNKSNGEVHA